MYGYISTRNKKIENYYNEHTNYILSLFAADKNGSNSTISSSGTKDQQVFGHITQANNTLTLLHEHEQKREEAGRNNTTTTTTSSKVEQKDSRQNGSRRNICNEGTNVTRYWKNSDKLAKWTKDYLDFHVQTRCNEDNLEVRNQTKYLVVQCLREFKKCGGTADRLQTLPVYIWYAAQSKRVLLIQWDSPCKLEEFFVPKEGGIDWTVPEWLQSEIPRHRKNTNLNELQKHSEPSNDAKFVTTVVQVYAAAVPEHFKNAMTIATKDENSGISVGQEEDFSYKVVFRDIFHSLFTLSPPVQSLFMTQMKRMGLVPGQYVTAHIRSRYPTGILKTNKNKLLDKEGGLKMTGEVERFLAPILTNAIHCAGNLLPGKPIYLASDSHEVLRYLRDKSDFADALKQNTIPPIVSCEHEHEPRHLDTPNYAKFEPHHFYSIFVDLWLLGEARCTTYGIGGFGQFGMHLSYNASCLLNHRKYTGEIQTCPSILPEK